MDRLSQIMMVTDVTAITEPGFPTTNFSRAFRRISERTPLEYRSDLDSGQLRATAGSPYSTAA